MSKKSKDQRKRKRVAKKVEDDKVVKIDTLKKSLLESKARTEALNYLVMWKKQAGWKFNKTRQVWLQKHWQSLE